MVHPSIKAAESMAAQIGTYKLGCNMALHTVGTD